MFSDDVVRGILRRTYQEAFLFFLFIMLFMFFTMRCFLNSELSESKFIM